MKSKPVIFIAQFLPLLFFYLFFAYPDEMLSISLTPLGRLVAIITIIFYTNIHLVYGLIICILIIFYYQMDMIEGMENFTSPSNTLSYANINVQNNSPNNNNSPNKNNTNYDIFDWIWSDPDAVHNKVYELPNEENQNNIRDIDDNINQNEGFISTPTLLQPSLLQPTQTLFRQQNCTNGQLIYKNHSVRNENAEFVFPEIRFTNGLCNACDTNCDFSIIQNKLAVQEDMTYPKVSDDWINKIWNTWFSEDYSKPYASVGVVSENFSSIR